MDNIYIYMCRGWNTNLKQMLDNYNYFTFFYLLLFLLIMFSVGILQALVSLLSVLVINQGNVVVECINHMNLWDLHLNGHFKWNHCGYPCYNLFPEGRCVK